MNLAEYVPSKRSKILVYGPPKSGKTVLVGKLANLGYKLWWFDLERGITSLLNPAVVAPENLKHISVFNIPDNTMLPTAYDVFRQVLRGGPKKFCFLHGGLNCPICTKDKTAVWSETIDINSFTSNDILVGDSLTQLADSAINKVTLVDRRKDEEYKLTFNDFGNQGQHMKEILTRIQTANIHICMIGHQIDAEKSESKEKIVPVAGTRNFSLTAAKYFDEVIYIQVLNKKHRAYSATTWSNTVVTGGRSGIHLEDAEEPSLDRLFKRES